MWDIDLVIMLRTEIGDFDSITYSDSRLQQVLVYAAYSVYQSAKFATTYTISVSDVTISPDPFITNDYDFSVLMVYKAACTILTGEAKTVGSKAVSIKDGPSFFDNRNAGSNLLALQKTACQTYADLLYNYQLSGSAQDGQSIGPGQAILGPYSPGSFLSNWGRNEGRSGHYY